MKKTILIGIKKGIALLVATALYAIMMPGLNFTVRAVEFDGGNGEEGTPYYVSTPEQLNEVRNNLDAYFIQTNDIDLTSVTMVGQG